MPAASVRPTRGDVVFQSAAAQGERHHDVIGQLVAHHRRRRVVGERPRSGEDKPPQRGAAVARRLRVHDRDIEGRQAERHGHRDVVGRREAAQVQLAPPL